MLDAVVIKPWLQWLNLCSRPLKFNSVNSETMLVCIWQQNNQAFLPCTQIFICKYTYSYRCVFVYFIYICACMYSCWERLILLLVHICNMWNVTWDSETFQNGRNFRCCSVYQQIFNAHTFPYRYVMVVLSSSCCHRWIRLPDPPSQAWWMWDASERGEWNSIHTILKKYTSLILMSTLRHGLMSYSKLCLRINFLKKGMVLFVIQMYNFHRIIENKAGGVERCYKSSCLSSSASAKSCAIRHRYPQVPGNKVSKDVHSTASKVKFILMLY